MDKDLQIRVEDLIHAIDIHLPNGRDYHSDIKECIAWIEIYVDKYNEEFLREE